MRGNTMSVHDKDDMDKALSPLQQQHNNGRCSTSPLSTPWDNRILQTSWKQVIHNHDVLRFFMMC